MKIEITQKTLNGESEFVATAGLKEDTICGVGATEKEAIETLKRRMEKKKKTEVKEHTVDVEMD